MFFKQIKNIFTKKIYVPEKLQKGINLFVIAVGIFGCISFLSHIAFQNKLAGFISLICYCIIYFYAIFLFEIEDVKQSISNKNTLESLNER